MAKYNELLRIAYGRHRRSIDQMPLGFTIDDAAISLEQEAAGDAINIRLRGLQNLQGHAAMFDDPEKFTGWVEKFDRRMAAWCACACVEAAIDRSGDSAQTNSPQRRALALARSSIRGEGGWSQELSDRWYRKYVEEFAEMGDYGFLSYAISSIHIFPSMSTMASVSSIAFRTGEDKTIVAKNLMDVVFTSLIGLPVERK